MGQELSRIALEYHRPEIERLYVHEKKPLKELMKIMKERYGLDASQSQYEHIRWEYYRPEIERLYIHEDKSRDEIKTMMEERHGFIASKWQYENIFKSWGWRKNLAKSDYVYIKHRIEKRKAEDDGKESAVYLHGRRVDPKRVKREIERPEEVHLRSVGWYAAMNPKSTDPAPSPPTPEGVLVKTPGTPGREELAFSFPTILSHHSQETNIRLMSGLRVDSLPSLQFEELVGATVRLNQSSGMLCKPAAKDSSSAKTIGKGLDLASWTTARQLSHINFSEHDLPPGLPSAEDLRGGISGFVIERSEKDLHSRIDRAFGPPTGEGFLEYVVLIGALASNNGLSITQSDDLLTWIIDCRFLSTFRLLQSLKTPAISAFGRCMFESAVRIGSIEGVEFFLRFGVNPSAPMKSEYNETLTPLIMAIRDENKRVIEILIQAGANINAYCKDGDGAYHTALHEAVYTGSIDLLRFVLDHGANIHPHQVAPNERCESVLETALRRSYGCLDCKIVKELLDRGADVNAPTLINPHLTALQAAALEGMSCAVTCLLDAGADVNAQAAVERPRESSESMIGGTLLQYCGFWDLEIVNSSAIGLGEDPDGNDWESSDSNSDNTSKADRKLVALINFFLNAGINVNAPALLDQKLVDLQCRQHEDCGTSALTALQGAVYSRDLEIVTQLVEAGANINAPAGHQCSEEFLVGSALRITAARAHGFKIAKYLIEKGADVNAPQPQSPLEAAIDAMDLELVQLLLDSGADCNFTAAYHTPLVHAAALPKHQIGATMIKLLVAAGADVNTPSDSTALVAAIFAENFQAVSWLLGCGANVNPNVWISPLEAAYRQNNSAIINLLLSYGARLNGSRDDEERCAMLLGSRAYIQNDITASAEDIQVLHFYSEDEEYWEYWTENALAAVAKRRDYEGLQTLLDAGADPEGTYHGLRGWNLEGKRLLSQSAVNNGRYYYYEGYDTIVVTTALLEAVIQSDLEAIRILLSANADINTRTQPYGIWTALQLACRKGNHAVITALLDANADINMPPHEDGGRTALQAAAIGGYLDIVRDLLQKGAMVNAPPAKHRGVTALQAAAIAGHLQITIDLLEARADPNAPAAEEEGRTALEGAAEHGRLDIFQLLVNVGADIGGDVINRARALAFENGQGVMVEYLDNMPGMQI